MIRHNNRKSLQELEQLAFVDPLTGGCNMQKFKIDAKKLLDKAPLGQAGSICTILCGYQMIQIY